VSPASAPVLESNPHVQRVITLDRRSWSSYQRVAGALRRARYDVVVDGRLNHPAVYTSTPLLLLASGARYRIGAGAAAPAGRGGQGADRVYNINVGAYDRTVHYIEGSKALARPFGVDADAVDWQPELFLTGAERARAESVWQAAGGVGGGGGGGGGANRLLANLSASEPRRRWADEHFITVLRDIHARRPDVSIVVIGLPTEWNRVSSVAAAVGARAAPTPRLREAFALVGTSSWVLTPDTSISHAASAFHRPVVVLLKRDHYPYAPWNTPSELVFWDGDTIAGLTVEPVLAAVRRLFG
jgi:ADP-heptose:LPS heptosyltransferase